MVYVPSSPDVTRWHRWLYWLLPNPCLACTEPNLRPAGSLGLCPACRGSLRPAPEACCASCGRPFERPVPGGIPEGFRCGECRLRPPAYDALYWIWQYRPPLDEVVAGLKFRRLDYLAIQLGQRMAEHPRIMGLAETVDAVVPVPLHWRRRLERGFDQAEQLAQPVAQALGKPLWHLLRRRRYTPPQSLLPKSDRKRNLAGAFKARALAKIRGKRLLLIDDVMTTGATFEAAARCLRAAGAQSLVAAAAARTPEPD